jgi:hypothetical protein
MAHQASPAVEEEEDTVWTSVRRISTQITTAIVGEDDGVDEEGGDETTPGLKKKKKKVPRANLFRRMTNGLGFNLMEGEEDFEEQFKENPVAATKKEVNRRKNLFRRVSNQLAALPAAALEGASALAAAAEGGAAETAATPGASAADKTYRYLVFGAGCLLPVVSTLPPTIFPPARLTTRCAPPAAAISTSWWSAQPGCRQPTTCSVPPNPRTRAPCCCRPAACPSRSVGPSRRDAAAL